MRHPLASADNLVAPVYASHGAVYSHGQLRAASPEELAVRATGDSVGSVLRGPVVARHEADVAAREARQHAPAPGLIKDGVFGLYNRDNVYRGEASSPRARALSGFVCVVLGLGLGNIK